MPVVQTDGLSGGRAVGVRYGTVEGLNVINDPKCNKVLNVITFCPKCNKVLNVITFCPKCNNNLP